MGITNLAPYGNGNGLKEWSFDDVILNQTDDVANAIVMRTQRLVSVYGPYNNGKENFVLLMTDLIYYVSEALFYWSGNVEDIVSPFRSERIGSYSYDKGAGGVKGMRSLLEDHDLIWPLLLHLKSLPSPIAISTRVVQQLEVNFDTGIRDMVDGYTNRLERSIARSGLVSDTESFNRIVYGDPMLGWPIVQ